MKEKNRSWIIRLLSCLTYTQKFFIISILFAISLLVCGYFMVTTQNDVISSSEIELDGNRYVRVLSKLIRKLPEHEWLTYLYQQGNQSLKKDLLHLTYDIDAIFLSLVNTDHKLQEQLRTQPEDFQLYSLPNLSPEQLMQQWNALKNRLFLLSPEENIDLHQQLVNDVYALFLYVGETANLILDPTSEANYFMETVLFELPEAQILIPKMRLLSQKFFNNQKVTESDRDQMLVYAAFLQHNIEKAKQSLLKGFVEEKNSLSELGSETRLSEALHSYLEASTALVSYTKAHLLDRKPISESDHEYISLAATALNSNFSLWNLTVDEFDNILNHRIYTYKTQQSISITISLLSAIIGLLLGFLIMREISRPLTNLAKATARLASGDLATRVDIIYEDEVGKVSAAFNRMAASLQELIGQLHWTGIQLTTSTLEISSAAEQQETAVTQQESTTKQIALTAKEISQTAKELAHTMNHVSSSAEETSALASAGKEGLLQMSTAMHHMVDVSQNIATKLDILNDKASNITSVITTIAKVADQTNLLSLNAAIEAEKAGEQGRSFSVIAREIRRLADQTANATLDIEKIVNEIVGSIAAGVLSVDKFSQEVRDSVELVTTVSEQLSKIIGQVQHQTISFESVNEGMQLQSLGAEQINKAITQLSDHAQKTTDSLKQFRSAIDHLNSAAQKMQQAVEKIKQ